MARPRCLPGLPGRFLWPPLGVNDGPAAPCFQKLNRCLHLGTHRSRREMTFQRVAGHIRDRQTPEKFSPGSLNRRKAPATSVAMTMASTPTSAASLALARSLSITASTPWNALPSFVTGVPPPPQQVTMKSRSISLLISRFSTDGEGLRGGHDAPVPLTGLIQRIRKVLGLFLIERGTDRLRRAQERGVVLSTTT